MTKLDYRALEAILSNVVSRLETDQEKLIPKIRQFLIHLNDYVNQEKLKNLLVYRRELDALERQVQGIRSAILEILNKLGFAFCC